MYKRDRAQSKAHQQEGVKSRGDTPSAVVERTKIRKWDFQAIATTDGVCRNIEKAERTDGSSGDRLNDQRN